MAADTLQAQHRAAAEFQAAYLFLVNGHSKRKLLIWISGPWVLLLASLCLTDDYQHKHLLICVNFQMFSVVNTLGIMRSIANSDWQVVCMMSGLF